MNTPSRQYPALVGAGGLPDVEEHQVGTEVRPAAVASSALDATGRADRKSVLHTLHGAAAMIRSAGRRIDGGDGDLAELTALAGLAAVVRQAVDAAATHLLEHTKASNQQIAAALGLSRQAVALRYPRASGRPAGGQRAGLR